MTRTHFAGQNGAATPGIDAALIQIAKPVTPQTTEQVNAMLRLHRAGMTGTVPQIVNREAPIALDATFIEPEPPRFSGLQRGDVLDRWIDRPALVGPVLIIGAAFLTAGVALALLIGGAA